MKDQSTRGFGLSFFIASSLALITLCCTVQLVASEPVPEIPETPDLALLVQQIIIESTKDGFEDEKHWNKTATRFDGLKIRGLNISKRTKKVRHGFCHKYSAKLNNPDKSFHIKIQEHSIPNEKVVAFSIQADLKARCEATFAQYTYGVKGLNGTMISDADIRAKLIISFDPQTKFSLSIPIPHLQMNAKVRDVDFWLKDVDVRQVGVFEGKIVEVIGDGLEEAIEQLLQAQESRVKKKLQKELDKIQGIGTKANE